MVLLFNSWRVQLSWISGSWSLCRIKVWLDSQPRLGLAEDSGTTDLWQGLSVLVETRTMSSRPLQAYLILPKLRYSSARVKSHHKKQLKIHQLRHVNKVLITQILQGVFVLLRKSHFMPWHHPKTSDMKHIPGCLSLGSTKWSCYRWA